MAEWIKAVVLGIVEGITEFLPISSTGHLLVFSALLDFENSLGGTFEIFIQIGAVVAVISFYHQDLYAQATTLRTDPCVQRFWIAIVVASVPAAIVGLGIRKPIKENLLAPENAPLNAIVVAVMLILGGLVFLALEWCRTVDKETVTTRLADIELRQALVVGILQTLALIPGVSRSGASIVGGMLAGLNRQAATAFSFYLAIPVLGGATILDLLLSLDNVDANGLLHLVLGAVVSGVVSWIAMGWLLRYLAHHSFTPFGVYRILAGATILGLATLGGL